MHTKKILLQFWNNNIFHLKKTNCKFQKKNIIHLPLSSYSRNHILITSATWNRRPNALTFRIRLNAATNCRVALINLQANTNTTKAITSSNVELNANVSQLIRIPIKTKTQQRTVQFAQRWTERSTKLSQSLNNDAIKMFYILLPLSLSLYSTCLWQKLLRWERSRLVVLSISYLTPERI